MENRGDFNSDKIRQLMQLRKLGCDPRCPAKKISEQSVAEKLAGASKVVVLTGAGISAESGIPTFRGEDGFWTGNSRNHQPQQLFKWAKFNEMPEDLWLSYKSMANVFKGTKPNDGHYALVELEQLIQSNFLLVTQNIDGLHLKAGSNRDRLHEIHGRIDEIRCDEHMKGACLHDLDLNDPTNFAKAKDAVVKPRMLPGESSIEYCAKCGVRQRPNILFFDERYNEALNGSRSVHSVVRRLNASDVLLIIGTQHAAGLPKWIVKHALEAGTTVIKIDTAMDLSDRKLDHMLCLQAKSGQCLPRIVSAAKKLIDAKKEVESALPTLSLPPSSPLPSDAIILPTSPITPTSTRTTLKRESSMSLTPPQTSMKQSKRKEAKAQRRALLRNEVATTPPRTPEKGAELLCATTPRCHDSGDGEVAGRALFQNDWSQWVEAPDCSSVVLTCVNEEPLGLNTDGGTDGVVYVEDVRPGTWAARMQMEMPCKLLAVNGQDVQCLSEGAFNDMMQRRPVNITLKRLQMRSAGLGECSRSEEAQAMDSRRRDRSRSSRRQQMRHPSIPSLKSTTDPVRVRSKPVLSSKPSLMKPTDQPLGDDGQTKEKRYRQKSLMEALLIIQRAQGNENSPLPNGGGLREPADVIQAAR